MIYLQLIYLDLYGDDGEDSYNAYERDIAVIHFFFQVREGKHKKKKIVVGPLRFYPPYPNGLWSIHFF